MKQYVLRQRWTYFVFFHDLSHAWPETSRFTKKIWITVTSHPLYWGWETLVSKYKGEHDKIGLQKFHEIICEFAEKHKGKNMMTLQNEQNPK